MFSPRQHLNMSQRLRRKAAVSRNPGPLLQASAKFLGLAKLALAKRLRQQPAILDSVLHCCRRGSATSVPQPSPGEASRYMGVCDVVFVWPPQR